MAKTEMLVAAPGRTVRVPARLRSDGGGKPCEQRGAGTLLEDGSVHPGDPPTEWPVRVAAGDDDRQAELARFVRQRKRVGDLVAPPTPNARASRTPDLA